jgi:hypothetical protein
MSEHMLQFKPEKEVYVLRLTGLDNARVEQRADGRQK